MKFIDVDRLRARIEKDLVFDNSIDTAYYKGRRDAEWNILTLIDSLRESEDERIRKEIIHYILYKASGVPEKQEHEWVSYLEKQKENPKSADSIPLDCVSGAKCEDRWHNVKDSLPDNGRLVLANDCLGNRLLARYDGEGNWEVSVYDNDDYYCRNTITKWCEIPSEKQKEQKPAQTVDEKEYVRTLKGLVSDFIRDSGGGITDVEYYQNICDWLDGRHIEQKSAEWSKEDKKMLLSIIRDFAQGHKSSIGQDKWLKSLLSHPKSSYDWEPSEEQMNELFHALIPGAEYDCDILEELYYGLSSWLDSIKERPEQK